MFPSTVSCVIVVLFREIIVGFVKPVFSDMVVQLKGDG